MNGAFELKRPGVRLLSGFLIPLLFTAVLSSCEGVGNASVSVGNTPVDNEVFLYYIDQAVNNGEGKSKQDVIVEAAKAVRYYVKVNTAAAMHKVSLSVAEKVALSERQNGFWAVFGTYLESVGVSKQTVGKIFLSEAYETALLTYFYGSGGQREVGQADLMNELDKVFVVFQSVKGAYTKTDAAGETTAMTDAEKELLVSRFKEAAGDIDDGTLTITAAASRLNPGSDGAEPEPVAVKKGTPYYSEDFFNALTKCKKGGATVITSNDGVYLVWRERVTADSGYFSENRLYALKQLKGEELKTLISSENTFEVEFSDNRASEFYNRIIKAHND